MDLERYQRQMLFAGLGPEGQRRLAAATVALIGVGATGSVLANALVRAGVGRLRIADRDYVELHNLQRQMLFDERDAGEGRPKAIAAAEKLRAVNSAVTIEPLVVDINSETIDEVAHGADLLLDGSDNFEVRYLINDVCVERSIPWIYCGALASYGMTMNITPGGPCFRCIFPEAPAPGTAPTCDTAGVLGTAVGTVASIAATEAIKLLAGRGTPNPGLISIDVWELSFDVVSLGPPRPDCPACGQRNFAYLYGEAAARTTSLCGRDAVQVRPSGSSYIDLHELAGRLREAGVAQLRLTEHLLRFTVSGCELTVFPDARAIVKGTEDETYARTLYARWIGM